MKRVLFSVVGTVAGLVALLSFKSHGQAFTAAGLPVASLGGASHTGAAAPTTAAPPDPSSRASTPGTHRSSTPSAPQSSAAAAVRTVVGPAEQTPYGVVQVKVSLSGHHITDVGFVQLTAYDGTSQQINQAAAPQLLQETLSAQSAQIDGVSGASYTSAGYEQSLQGALDQAAR